MSLPSMKAQSRADSKVGEHYFEGIQSKLRGGEVSERFLHWVEISCTCSPCFQASPQPPSVPPSTLPSSVIKTLEDFRSRQKTVMPSGSCQCVQGQGMGVSTFQLTFKN